MNTENERVMKINYVVLNDLPGELYTIETDERCTDNRKYPLATMQGLAKLLKMKIGAKVMLTANLNKQDCLFNGKRNVGYIEFAQFSL